MFSVTASTIRRAQLASDQRRQTTPSSCIGRLGSVGYRGGWVQVIVTGCLGMTLILVRVWLVSAHRFSDLQDTTTVKCTVQKVLVLKDYSLNNYLTIIL